MGISNGVNIKLTNENIKLFIFLAMLPIFIFSVSIASKAIYRVDEFAPIAYEENNIKILKILNSDETAAVLRVEIADSTEERKRGLSGRNTLSQNKGMLFVFSEPDFYKFWMKDMNFGLDFIWINGDEIIEVTKNVKSEDYQPPDVLVPKEKIDKVLEVNAGEAERLNIKTGDKIEF